MLCQCLTASQGGEKGKSEVVGRTEGLKATIAIVTVRLEAVPQITLVRLVSSSR